MQMGAPAARSAVNNPSEQDTTNIDRAKYGISSDTTPRPGYNGSTEAAMQAIQQELAGLGMAKSTSREVSQNGSWVSIDS